MIEIKPSFRITGIFHRAFDRIFHADYVFGGETHDFWEIVYVDEGSIEVVENDEVYLLHRGDILFHAPMEFHRIRTGEDAPAHVYNLSFAAEGAALERLKDGVFALDPDERASFLRLFAFVRECLAVRVSPTALVWQEAAHSLAAFLLRRCNGNEARESPAITRPAETYRALTRAMARGVRDNLTLPTIAAECFVSVSYAKALFSRYAGISPKTYYNALRLAETQRLLLGGASVTAVAEEMHFSSPNNLIRFFKRETGMTPLQYKKQV